VSVKCEDLGTVKRMMGTATVTAVHRRGQGVGWGIPNAESTLTVTVGGIATKPGIVEGRVYRGRGNSSRLARDERPRQAG